MKQVFLSYSTMDILETIELRDFLEENGVSCWMGKRDIQPGANYTVEITTAIDQCEIFVLILTENAQNSQYVISELECARAKKKTIIPYMLQEFTICESLEFHIRNCQRIHAYEYPAKKKYVLLENVWLRLTNNTIISSRQVKEKEERQINNAQSKIQDADRVCIYCPKCQSTILIESVSIWQEFLKNRRFAIKFSLVIAIYVDMFILMIPKKNVFFNAIIESLKKEALTPEELQLLSIDPVAEAIVLLGITIITAIIILSIRWSLKMDSRNMPKKEVLVYRCVQCEKRFTVSVPEGKRDQYYVKNLIESTEPDRNQRFINIFCYEANNERK